MRRAERTASFITLAGISAIALHLALSVLPFSQIAVIDAGPVPSVQRIFLPLRGRSYLSAERFHAVLEAGNLPYIDSIGLSFSEGRASVSAGYRTDGVMLVAHDRAWIAFPGSYPERMSLEDVPFLSDLYPAVEVPDGFLSDPFRDEVIAGARGLQGLSSLITWMKYGNNYPESPAALAISLTSPGTVLYVRDPVPGEEIRKSVETIMKEGAAGCAYELTSAGLSRAERG